MNGQKLQNYFCTLWQQLYEGVTKLKSRAGKEFTVPDDSMNSQSVKDKVSKNNSR